MSVDSYEKWSNRRKKIKSKRKICLKKRIQQKDKLCAVNGRGSQLGDGSGILKLFIFTAAATFR